MLVHIIKPSGTRHELMWPDGTKDHVILNQMTRNKVIYGYNSKIVRLDNETQTDVLHEDKSSGFVFDNPATIVCVVDQHGNELRRLKGPPVIKANLNPPSPGKITVVNTHPPSTDESVHG